MEVTTAAELHIARMLDPPLLESLHDKLSDQHAWVLVTDDDSMPLEHAAVLAKLGTTVATLDGRNRPIGPPLEDWKWEVVQRWAHAMASQSPKSIRRYRPNSNRVWTPRLR